ncbi:hypothetical protein BGZ65_001487 [Modicella reniformis]|uniref:F-box domain-containing protein n=1 Tax=Modicella reniformis TaxID=1440133 RepID=A0A9P6J6E2_9FUNG|nr:hypothetical protein BGZ65_001487 [Modicella reniformis]
MEQTQHKEQLQSTVLPARNQSELLVPPAHQNKDNEEDADKRSNLDQITSFRFEQLPTEIQLRVVHHIASERELLQFRLVSSLTDALVLDPGLWQEIDFSKQQYFKTGGSYHRKDANSSNSSSRSPYHHSSVAGIIVHRQSWADSLLESSSQQLSVGEVIMDQPSLHITANIPRAIPSSRCRLSMTMSTSSADIRSWTSIENSFLAFIHRLASRTGSAHRLHRVAIKDWEGEESIKSLWRELRAFDTLEELSIISSFFQHCSIQAVQGPDPTTGSWIHLRNLDLKGCTRFHDLSTILQLMPRLEELSLEDCLGLEDFSPLVSPSAVESTQDLPYRKINFIFTRICDSNLIELLRRSPCLEELRLDRCYNLTEASLMAMGYGHERPTAQQDSGKDQVHHDAPHGPEEDLRTHVSTSFCPKLKVLSLRDCYDLGNEGIRALAGCPQHVASLER